MLILISCSQLDYKELFIEVLSSISKHLHPISRSYQISKDINNSNYKLEYPTRAQTIINSYKSICILNYLLTSAVSVCVYVGARLNVDC